MKGHEPANLSKLLSLTEYRLHIQYDCDDRPTPVQGISFTRNLGWTLRYNEDNGCYGTGEQSLKGLTLLTAHGQPGQINVYDESCTKADFHLLLQRTEVVGPSYEEMESFLA